MSRPKEVSDTQIIEAARRVFLAHGAQTSVAKVAGELGVSSTALHLRMGSKRALLLKALCPSDPAVLVELFEEIPADTPVKKRLRAILAELEAWAEAEIPATFTLYSIGMRPQPGEEIDNSQPLRLRRALAGWLRRAARFERLAIRPRAAAEVLLGTLEARALHRFVSGESGKESERRAFLRELVATVFPDA
ncbi:MAG TPA: helix-turn-helix domain-containing protein [Gammaproteobacteria bacterium]|nr:helix-turn-helix domain-containing protein [Gammaproteobacteria bacterium]